MVSCLKVEKFVKEVASQLGEPPDLVERYYEFDNAKIVIIFLKDIVKYELISDNILKQLFLQKEFLGLENFRMQIATNCVCKVEDKSQVYKYLLIGHTIIATEEDKILVCDTTTFPKRAPSEPPTSAVVKGPRNGFVDDIVTNLSLIRKSLKTKSLRMKDFFVGDHTQTRVTIAYIDGVVDKRIVKEVEKRIGKIKTNGIIDSYYVGQFIVDNPKSLFSQVGTCEKPDIATSRMLEGRIAIFVDNTPVVLTVPYIIMEDLQNSNDYYQNYLYSNFMRFIRVFGVFMAVIVPALYLSFRLYHYKLIPYKFLVTISNSTQGLPFTPFVEIFFILILFELLYEVSLRLPQYLGLATGIVGALILGDTGVSAGLISPPAVMVVALSIISIYTMPDQRGQLSVLRLVFLLLGAIFGYVGIIFGVIVVISEMSKINTFSTSYLSPFAPFNANDFADSIVKHPICENDELPQSIPHAKQKKKRGKNNE